MNLSEQQKEDFERCVKQISENLNHPFTTSRILQDHFNPNMYCVFIDVLSGSYMTFDTVEIQSAKNFRQLRNLVKLRLIHAIQDLKNLAENSLKQLGIKEPLLRGDEEWKN